MNFKLLDLNNDVLNIIGYYVRKDYIESISYKKNRGII